MRIAPCDPRHLARELDRLGRIKFRRHRVVCEKVYGGHRGYQNADANKKAQQFSCHYGLQIRCGMSSRLLKPGWLQVKKYPETPKKKGQPVWLSLYGCLARKGVETSRDRLGLGGRVLAGEDPLALFGKNRRLSDVHRFGILGAVAGDLDGFANLQRVFS